MTDLREKGLLRLDEPEIGMALSQQCKILYTPGDKIAPHEAAEWTVTPEQEIKPGP